MEIIQKLKFFMKVTINTFIMLTFSSNILAMFVKPSKPITRRPVKVQSMSSEERTRELAQREALIKRISAIPSKISAISSKVVASQFIEQEIAQQLGLSPLGTKGKGSVKWVRTTDGIESIDMNNANEMQALLIAKGDSRENPIDMAVGDQKISSWELLLLSHAYDALANGTFDQYYDSLSQEYGKVKQNITLGESRLQQLTSAAGKVQAKTLSALLAAKIFPGEMQQSITPEAFVEPVIAYLKEQLLEKIKVTYKSIPFDGELISFAFNADNSKCLMGGRNGKFELFDINTRMTIDLSGNFPQNSTMRQIAANKIGDRALSSTEGNSFLWNIPNSQILVKLTNLHTASFSPEGDRILYGIGNSIKMLQSSDGQLVDSFDADQGTAVEPVCWHPNGRYFVSTATSNNRDQNGLIIWDTLTHKHQILPAETEEGDSTAIFSPRTGDRFFSRMGSQITMWKFLIDKDDSNKFNCIQDNSLAVDPWGFVSLQFSADEERCSVRYSDEYGSYIRIFNSELNQLIIDLSLSAKQMTVDLLHPYLWKHEYRGQFSPDNIFYAVFDPGIISGQLSFYNSKTGRFIKSMWGAGDVYWHEMAFDKTGNKLFVNGRRGGIDEYRLFEEHDMKILDTMKSELNVAQWLLLYRLYLAKEKGISIAGPFKREVMKTFAELSPDIQKMVQTYLLPKDIFSGIKSYLSSWWGK